MGSSRNISDEDSFTKENLNGSLFDALSDESSSPAPFGTLEAEITQETIDFFVSDAEGDPDCPSPGYSSIEQALTALRQEKVEYLHRKSFEFVFLCDGLIFDY